MVQPVRAAAAAPAKPEMLSFADVTMKDGLLTSLGIDEGDVGKEGAMPSIGADGEPISVSTGQ